MALQSYNNIPLIKHLLQKMIDACDLIATWNEDVKSCKDYLNSPRGVEKMAATCMLIESIGEGVKK